MAQCRSHLDALKTVYFLYLFVDVKWVADVKTSSEQNIECVQCACVHFTFYLNGSGVGDKFIHQKIFYAEKIIKDEIYVEMKKVSFSRLSVLVRLSA